MNRYAKRAAQILLPKRVFTTIQSIRSRNYQMRLHKEWGVYQATREMIDSYGLTVLYGPFRGMRYPKSSLLHRDGIPILFGTYEFELHPIIEEVASNKYTHIVDIGSAEGYYAVGLALRTKTGVHAFDCEPRELHYLRQMARLNGVADLIQTGSWCDSKVLSKLVRGRRCLIISDCEGYEIDLFDEECIAALKASDLIIELHENGPELNAHDKLLKRFQISHKSRVVAFDQNNFGSTVPRKWHNFAREFRTPGQQWLYLNPVG
jgi:hypothetical protein